MKKDIQNEDELLQKNNDNESIVIESSGNTDETVEIDDQIFEKIDSIVLDENETPNLEEIEEDLKVSSESEIIDISNELNEVKKLDGLYTIGKNNYYFDKKNNTIYYKSVENNFAKYNIYTYDKEIIDTGLDKIKLYDKDNIVYSKVLYDETGDVGYEIVFYSIKNGMENRYKLSSVRQIYFDDYNKDKVYVLTNHESRSLYLITNKNGMSLIDENVSDVYGVTKKSIYYSKYEDAGIPYNLFLIDNVSSGEWLGEEPVLSDYKNNDDPFSFDYDIDGYTAARFAYKYKEKFLNDRKKYVDKNIENIKSNDYKYSLNKLYSYDGKNKNVLNENYVRNVYILSGEKDIVYFETDTNLMTMPISKKTLGEFVIGDVLIDQYIEGYFDETKKEFLSFIKNDNHISNIKDLDLYRGYIDKSSSLYYDSKYRQAMREKEKRNINIFDDIVFINSTSNTTERSMAYSFKLSKDNIIFPAPINMDTFDKIKIIDYIDEPIYIVYNDNAGTLKHGIRTISSNVIVDSVITNSAKNKIAYIEPTDSNVNGILHRVNIKNNYEDYIVSKNAFYYNLCFDTMDDSLCYLINFIENEEYGTFLTIDNNNKITFIDDEVTYIIKN